MRIRIIADGQRVDEYKHDGATPIPHARDLFSHGGRQYYVAWRFIESAPPASPLVVLHCGTYDEPIATLRGES